MNNKIKKSDSELKEDVLSELKYEPTVKVNEIGVLVHDGTVTLNGFTTSYGEKSGAVRAAKRVAGVNAIADDVVVKLPTSHQRSDGDIAHAALKQIEWCTTISPDDVTVTVRAGWVTLEGCVEWWYLSHNAEMAVQHLAGVTGVTNLMKISPTLSPVSVENSIESAFRRNAQLDAAKITVITEGNQVTLTGVVRNHAEREEAQRATWAAPGVGSVVNNLTVKWAWFD